MKMANHELVHWKYHSSCGEFIEVPPDGCNDIIFTIGERGNLAWHITELPETCDSFKISEATYLEGIRFNPATQINRTKMLDYMRNTTRPADELIKTAGEFVSFDENLHQALMALGEIDLSIEKCAANLGVGLRSLQRYTLAQTGKSPKYWRQLARARIAARTLFRCGQISETAYICNYADQSHLTRAMRKWFGRTPKQIIEDVAFNKLILGDAYF